MLRQLLKAPLPEDLCGRQTTWSGQRDRGGTGSGEGDGIDRRLLKARPCSGGRYYSESLKSVPKKPLGFPTSAVPPL